MISGENLPVVKVDDKFQEAIHEITNKNLVWLLLLVMKVKLTEFLLMGI